MKEVGIYVHIPYCSGKCRYCNFVSTVNFSSQEQFVDRLCAEIAACGYSGEVDTVYIGGGTPSTLKNGLLSRIFERIYAKFRISDGAEITVEANPESATDDFFDECVKNKVNRISMGLQCADDEVLNKAGRRHVAAQFVEAVNRAKLHGIENISGDFIIGLEGETTKNMLDTLELMVRLDLNHISAYSLSVEKGSIMFAGDYRPDEDKMADDYELASKFLIECGYERYEISNFAKNGAVSRHNTKYWLHKPYIGFGPAAHSYFNGVRFANTESVAKYLNGETRVFEQKITLDELKTEFVMLRLRLKNGFSVEEYDSIFNADFEREKAEKLKKLYNAGVIKKENGRIFATDKGIYILNYIITELI